jgi:peroxin-12
MSDSVSNVEYASIISNNLSMFKPNIFDILAQENMHSLVRPAFQHSITWLARNMPVLSSLSAHKNKLYLILHSTIEYVYLRAFDSLFSEHFYGMRRHSISNNKQRLLCVLFSVIWPFLKFKLDEFYEDVEREQDESQYTQQTSNPLLNSFKKLVLKFYPYLHAFYSLWIWFVKFKFMFGVSESSSPFLSLLGLKLIYDVQRGSQSGGSIPQRTSYLRTCLTLLSSSFTTFMYFIQFLKWYEEYMQNRSFQRTNDLTESFSLDELSVKSDESTNKPPSLPLKLKSNKIMQKILENRSLCPLCLNKRKNECVLSVSGFVFCYTCLYKFVKEHQRCPITSYSCSTRNIIRVYSSNE